MIESAQRKLLLLVQQAEDAQALAQAARKQVSDAERRAQLLLNSMASEADIARAMVTVEAARDLTMSRHRRYEECEQLCTRLRSWISEMPRNTTLEPVTVKVDLLNGKAPSVVVGEIRSKIAALSSEYHAIKLAPAPLDDARRQARELVERLGRKGAPVVRTQGGELYVRNWNAAEIHGPTTHDVTIATLCWAMPDVMIAKLDEVFEAQPHNDGALPVADRASRLAEIEAQIFDLEIQEEAVISAAERDGTIIPRRYDQSPPSILGVRVIASATARVAA